MLRNFAPVIGISLAAMWPWLLIVAAAALVVAITVVDNHEVQS